MKYYELTPEEQKLLEEIEKGNFVRAKDFKKVKGEIIAAAKNTSSKTKNINIRISEKVLSRLKAKAAEAGLPYQTLASSVLHRYASK